MAGQMSESLPCAAIARARSRARAALCASLVALACALCACTDKPSAKDCEALLDRIIDFEMEAAGTDHISPAMKDDLDKQRKELHGYLSESFVEDCQKNMPVAVVKCGLDAKNLSEYATCEE
jgi:hypothetical protein